MEHFRILTQQPHAEVGPDGSTGVEINEHSRGYSFTSDDGSFLLGLRSLAPGQRVRLVALADGLREDVIDTASVRPVDGIAASAPLQFRLTAPRALAVRVVEDGPGHRPVADARVTVRDINPRVAGAFDWARARSGEHRPVSLLTDTQGWARFGGLFLNDGIVLVEKEGCGRGRRFWTAGEKTMVVPVASKEAVIEGRVFDETGAPVDKATVWLKWADAFPYEEGNIEHSRAQTTLTVEDNGRFRFDQLPPGAYALRVARRCDGPIDARYVDEFVLQAGQSIQVTYPDDAVANNPGRWLAEGTEAAEDQALRDKLTGAWYQRTRSGSGAPVLSVYDFREDGSFDRWIYKGEHGTVHADGSYSPGPAHRFHDTGFYKVEAGSVRIAFEAGSTAVFTAVMFPEDDRLILGRANVPADLEQTYRRAKDLDRILAEGEAMSQPSTEGAR